MKTNQILQGHVLDALKTLPPENVDCAITSPPYWSLRDYKTKPQIWDGDKNCNHQWGEKKKTLSHKSGETNPGKEGWYKDRGASDDRGSQFCVKCEAWKGSLGLEPDFNLYIKHICDIYDEVKRVLKKEGSCWINMGDTYSAAHTGGHKSAKLTVGANRPEAQEFRQVKKHNFPDKCLLQIPSRLSIEMCNRGWILRNVIIWKKPNCMPTSACDRFTIDWEYFFFFAKNKKYYFEQQFEPHHQDGRKVTKVKGGAYSIQHRDGERWPGPGRNKRCVWTIVTKPYKEAHFAVFPEKLIETPIKASCPKNGIVLDPFIGSGTTAVVAKKLNRNWLGIELNPDYIKLAEKRIANAQKSML